MKEFIKNNYSISSVTEIKKHPDKSVYEISTLSGKYILKEKNNIEQINHEYELLYALLQQEFPVQSIMPTLHNRPYSEYKNSYYCLYHFIDGDHISDKYSLDNKKHLPLFGNVLATLHAALSKIQISIENHQNIKKDINEWVKPTLIRAGIDDEIINHFSQIFDKFCLDLKNMPVQYIHRDFHSENVLFLNAKLVGVIDFEIAYKSIKIFDICYFCTGFLQEGFNSEEKRKN